MRPLDVPAWFTRAVEAAVVAGAISTADGRRVAYRRWGQGTTPVVLVHGGAAHSRWWDHVGPLLVDDDTTVVAVDLAGHGDSDRQHQYTLEAWADDVVALATDPTVVGSRPRPPILVGHSMGGLVTWTAAARHGGSVAGMIAIDAPIGDREPELSTPERSTRPYRRYPSHAEIVARFRTLPAQDAALDYVLAHIAKTSVRQVADGWVWKHDPMVLRRPFSTLAVPARGGCRLAFLRAEHGIVAERTIRFIAESVGDDVLMVDLPGAAHHVMLDHPLALAEVLQALLHGWAAECNQLSAPSANRVEAPTFSPAQASPTPVAPA